MAISTVNCELFLGEYQMSLIELQSLQEAIRLLIRIRRDLAAGSTTLWRLLLHAGQHLDQQLAKALAPEVL
jgi:hypothetical protein